MERAVCEQCGHWQPGDWAAGDLCVACGAAVRRDVRCAWCAEWTPASRYCRGCGCEVVSPEMYGPARMLKSAGVDRFTLAQRLRELDPEQAANLGRIYNAQLAVVARRVEELRLCESCLVQRVFSRRLEDELVPQLPLERQTLAELAAGPAGPFDHRPELLPEIAQHSPVGITRALASIALLRMGQFKGPFEAACQALNNDDRELALEAALAFAHWRVRLCPYGLWRRVGGYSWLDGPGGIDRRRLAEVADSVPRGSPLRPWAAAAVTLAWCGEYGVAPEPEPGGRPGETEPPLWVREALAAGLTSRDADLRFSCAIALGEDGVVARVLDSADPQQQLVARTCLAKQKSAAIAPLLIDGPEETRAEILENLRDPLPQALVEPVLRAVERTGEENRAKGVRLLLASLDEHMVERLVHLAQRKKDAEVFKALLGAEQLPAAQTVVRAAIQAGLFEAVHGALHDAAEHVDFTDEAVTRLAAKGDAAVIEKLIGIADRQLDRLAFEEPAGGAGRGGGIARLLAGVAFGAGPVEIRSRAYRVLDQHHRRRWDWMSPEGIRELFGDASGFLKALLSALAETEREAPGGDLLRKLSERWAELEETLTQDRAGLADLVKVLQRKASEDSEAAQLLVKVAVSRPAAALPAVAGLLREAGSKWALREVPADLLAEYDALAQRVASEKSLAADLAGALCALLGKVTLECRYVSAIQLLARLVKDHPKLRKGTAAEMTRILRDRQWGDRMLQPALEELAQAVGFQEEPEAEVPKEPEPPSIPDEILDNLALLPDAPLKTLGEYCAFMKAMGKAKDPMAVMASYGLTQENLVECMTRWGEVICGNDQIALRYARLMTPEGPS